MVAGMTAALKAGMKAGMTAALNAGMKAGMTACTRGAVRGINNMYFEETK
jgi:hypothetical protein